MNRGRESEIGHQALKGQAIRNRRCRQHLNQCLVLGRIRRDQTRRMIRHRRRHHPIPEMAAAVSIQPARDPKRATADEGRQDLTDETIVCDLH